MHKLVNQFTIPMQIYKKKYTTMSISALLVLCALVACGPDYQVPDPVDNGSPSSGQGTGTSDGGSGSGSDTGTDGTGDGGAAVSAALLSADGNDAATYTLMTSKGYNYETPDADHNPAVRHIRQVQDATLGKWVFAFDMHIATDTNKGEDKDRQRNEIKTDAHSPASMVAQEGETLSMTWKFKLPAGMRTTTKFSHIHQLKGIDNSEGTADVANPIITFTCRSLSSGSQQFQVIHTTDTPASGSATNEYYLKTDLAEFLGEWVSVSETVTFAEKGTYSVVIVRMRDGKKLAEFTKTGVDLWRSGTTGMRPKWGLYRNFGDNHSLAAQLRDETLLFADFDVQKVGR